MCVKAVVKGVMSLSDISYTFRNNTYVCSYRKLS